MTAQTPRIIDFIAASAWFEGLPSDAIEMLAARAVLKTYTANQCLYLVNEQAVAVYGIMSGTVRVSVSSSDGQEFILTHLGAGAWLGEAALVGDRHRVQEARVKQQAEILSIPSSSVLLAAAEYPVVYKNLFTKQLRRTRAVYETLAGSLFYPLKARVAGRFLDLIKRHGRQVSDGIALDFRLSQNEFANMTMGSRQRVNQIFRDWVKRGILRKEGERYVVMDIAALEKEIDFEASSK